MTTLQQIELECPVCENRFRTQAVLATNSFGGKQTDFHERAVGTQPLPFLVHTCDRCGFSGLESDFADADEVTPWLREQVWSELAPALTGAPVSGSEKYELAARIAEWQHGDARRVGDLLLRAAWCCMDEEDVEAERYYRRRAARAFEAALAAWAGVDVAERAVVTYLVGELWRRVGDRAQAHEWFDRVADEIVDPAAQRWVLDAARQQRDRPREWFR